MSPAPSLGPGWSGSSGEEALSHPQRMRLGASRFALSTGDADIRPWRPRSKSAPRAGPTHHHGGDIRALN